MASGGLRAALIAAVTAAAVIALGLFDSGRSQGAPRHAELRAFRSCDQLRGYVRRHAPPPLPVAPVAGAEAAADAGGRAPTENATNVQEAGVGEPDLVKVGERTMFAIAGDRLRAVDLGATLPAVLDSIELPDGPGAYADPEERELLIADDRALVISRSYAGRARTVLTELDVSNPAAMVELRTLVVDGDYVSARLVGHTARVVIGSGPPVGPVPLTDVVVPEPSAAAMPARNPVPRTVLHDRIAKTKTRARLLGCRGVLHPRRFSGAQLLSVLTIDLQRGLPAVDADAVMAGGETVYASPDSLYVATEDWVDPSAPADRTSDVVTEIHRFDIGDPDSTEYVASGRVEGFMLSQWSMSEQNGVLRVASTTAPPWEEGLSGGESETFVTVLATDGDRLTRIGRLGDIGRGEDVYAVRFFDSVGYIVTFRQIDPLHVIDLSDPAAPRLAGELEIPGYSAYLHPVGDGLLLGVGQGVRDGAPSGVQVSLFDVRDPAAPKRLDLVDLGGGISTEVETDHHAFAFDPASGLAVIPVDSWRGTHQVGGAIGVRVTDGGLARTARTDDGRGAAAATRRAVIDGGVVYTVSERGVGVHDASTLERLAFTPFAG
jgi:uncharacterized secreted protein with C-terminal beta-propeller domain